MDIYCKSVVRLFDILYNFSYCTLRFVNNVYERLFCIFVYFLIGAILNGWRLKYVLNINSKIITLCDTEIV